MYKVLDFQFEGELESLEDKIDRSYELWNRFLLDDTFFTDKGAFSNFLYNFLFKEIERDSLGLIEIEKNNLLKLCVIYLEEFVRKEGKNVLVFQIKTSQQVGKNAFKTLRIGTSLKRAKKVAVNKGFFDEERDGHNVLEESDDPEQQFVIVTRHEHFVFLFSAILSEILSLYNNNRGQDFTMPISKFGMPTEEQFNNFLLSISRKKIM